MRVLRSVVVRIVLVMTAAFNLNFTISVGRDKSAHRERPGSMSDEARQLAEEVNKRQAHQQTRDQLQLHKAGILRAKGYDFWNNFAILFRKEFTDFNRHLKDAEYQIETFDDKSTLYTVKLHGGKSGAHASCKVDIEGQRIFLAGESPRSTSKLAKGYGLTVDDEDNIQIRDDSGSGVGGVVTESIVILEVLKFFAQ